ncbi:MAG TPA: DUF5990 family protein [Acidimicrobiales bacterium]|nr:DUF5990 family protein [Acidimicrobiales bacterium]
MELVIEGVDLPGATCGPGPDRPDGHHGIHVGVPRRGRQQELLGLTPGDAASATWVLPVQVAGADVRGPWVQGRPGNRFVYLSWVTVEGGGEPRLFRRAKVMLAAVPGPVLAAAAASGRLVARIGLTDAKGHPTCAALRPPLVEWRAG